MRVGAFKRIASYLIDIIPIISVLSILFSLVVGQALKPENYDALMEEYQEINEEFNEVDESYREDRDNGEMTQTEYEELLIGLQEDYNEETADHFVANLTYMFRMVSYFYIGQGIIYIAYNLITKGKTIGRKLMKIELQGKITWWRLIVREFLWKTGYWLLTLGVFGIVLDLAMISLSKKKQAPRDYVSGIYVGYEGVEYPF